MTRLTQQELAMSTLANRKSMPAVTANAGNPGFQIQSLVRVQTIEGLAQAWRVTLGRLDRADDTAVAHPGDPGVSGPIYINQLYEYRAWVQGVPIVPPRRASPIFDALDPANGATPNDCFVEIAWGMADGKPNRLLAHWPVQGASIVLVGSYVEVWGAGRIASVGVPPAPAGSFPNFQATITEDRGLSTPDGSELSLNEFTTVQNAVTVANLFPDGVAHPATSQPALSDPLTGIGATPGIGLTVENPAGGVFAPVGALRGSAVLGVGPFAGWNPQYRPVTAGRQPRLMLQVQGSGLFPNVQVFNNSAFDRNGNLLASNGDVAVLIDTTTAPQLTFALLEAAITAGAPQLNLFAASPNGAFFIQSAAALPFANVVTYTPGLASIIPGLAGNVSIAEAIMGPTIEGATVYVPDFARRVRIVLVTLTAPAGTRIPVAGDPVCVIVFYDDRGVEVDEYWQSTSGGNAAPPAWMPVPARAVMVGIYPNPADGTQYSALIHWRIAP